MQRQLQISIDRQVHCNWEHTRESRTIGGKMKYFKVMNQAEYHHELQYKTGLNIDPIPFNPHGKCNPGGIYFCEAKHVFRFLDYAGTDGWIREVTIPDDAQIYHEVYKVKADRVILGKRMSVKRAKTFNLLLKAGADLHVQEDIALRWAAKYGYHEVVKTLLKAGADVHAEDNESLCFAAKYGHLEVVKTLLKAGADVHAWGDYALYWAAANGYLAVVETLLKAGADVHTWNDRALRWAADYGHIAVVKALLRAGANVHAWNNYALCSAAANGYLEVVKTLLKAGADVHADSFIDIQVIEGMT